MAHGITWKTSCEAQEAQSRFGLGMSSQVQRIGTIWGTRIHRAPAILMWKDVKALVALRFRSMVTMVIFFLAQPQSAWSWKLIDSVHTFFWQPSGNGIGVTFLLHGQVISNAQDASTLGKSWLSPKSGSWWTTVVTCSSWGISKHTTFRVFWCFEKIKRTVVSHSVTPFIECIIPLK